MNMAVLDEDSESFLGSGCCGARDIDARHVRLHRGVVEIRFTLAREDVHASLLQDGAVMLVPDHQEDVISPQPGLDRPLKYGGVRRDFDEIRLEVGVDSFLLDQGGQFRSDPVLDPFMKVLAPVAQVHGRAGTPASKSGCSSCCAYWVSNAKS